jgi:hypothetical protein
MHIFSRFLMRLGNIFVTLLQNECPYMITMFIIYVGLWYDQKGQM